LNPFVSIAKAVSEEKKVTEAQIVCQQNKGNITPNEMHMDEQDTMIKPMKRVKKVTVETQEQEKKNENEEEVNK
jgi:hypothetical protein